VAEAKKALDGTDIEAIKAAGEKLQQAGYKLAEIVYSDQEAQTGASAGTNGGDDVVDADYEVVDE
jgi:molecular chaperone DnaK